MSKGLKANPQNLFTFRPYQSSSPHDNYLKPNWKHSAMKILLYTLRHLGFTDKSHVCGKSSYWTSICPSASALSFSTLRSLLAHPLPLCSLSFLQACNTKYPDYDKTGSICVSEHINNTLTRYRWLISAPAGLDGVTSPVTEVDFDTFATSSKMITLDSVYFQAGSRVQCVARAVNSNGDEGLELSSPIVTISQERGRNRTMTESCLVHFLFLQRERLDWDLVPCCIRNEPCSSNTMNLQEI